MAITNELPKLGSLRTLDFSGLTNVGTLDASSARPCCMLVTLFFAPSGVQAARAIGECEALRIVRLAYCENLSSEALVHLSTLPELEVCLLYS